MSEVARGRGRVSPRGLRLRVRVDNRPRSLQLAD